MIYKIYLTNTSVEKTEYELFPQAENIIENWNQDMANRILPVASFNTKMADEQLNSLAVFLYYEDYSISYLSWEMNEDNLITIVKEWQKITPFNEKPDINKIKESIGGYLKFESFVVEIGLPSEYDYENTWNDHFEDELLNAGAKNPLNRMRIGGGYPCYVQGYVDYDDTGYIGEFPTGKYRLSPFYLYLSTNGKGKYYQEMQMT